MDNPLRGKDLLSLTDLAPADVLSILDAAEHQKRLWSIGKRLKPLEGKSVAVIMQKPSMRTRVSFEMACVRLGAHPVIMSGNDNAFSRGESVHDTVKVLERYCDAIVLRTYAQSLVEEVAHHASVPVINALTDDYHPCQGLADLLTIREKLGRLAGVRMAYVGDGNNMANTYLQAGALTGMAVTIASPTGYEVRPEVVAQAAAIAENTGASVSVGTDPHAAVAGADVVITDTWASMGQEDEHAARAAAFAAFTVDRTLFSAASPEAIFMHCLPAHRGEEVTDDVIDDARSVVFDEAANRLHAQQALLSLVLG